MTEKQKRFCDEYIKNGANGAQAYKTAYPNIKKEEAARVNASKLLIKTDIKEYIESQNKILSDSGIADMQEIKRFWTTVMRNKEEKPADRLKASELIAKTNGAFLDKVEMKNPVPVQILDDIPSGEKND